LRKFEIHLIEAVRLLVVQLDKELELFVLGFCCLLGSHVAELVRQLVN